MITLRLLTFKGSYRVVIDISSGMERIPPHNIFADQSDLPIHIAVRRYLSE